MIYNKTWEIQNKHNIIMESNYHEINSTIPWKVRHVLILTSHNCYALCHYCLSETLAKKIQDVTSGTQVWDKYIRQLRAELLILVPAASEKSSASTNLSNKRYIIFHCSYFYLNRVICNSTEGSKCYHQYFSFRMFGVGAFLASAGVFQSISRLADLPRTAKITYSRIFREIGGHMVLGAYAGERMRLKDATCDNDNVLGQLLREYEG